MKKLLLLLLSGSFLFFTSAYDNGPGDADLPWTYIEGNTDWMRIKPDVTISKETILRDHNKDLGLTTSDELVLYKTQFDDLGFTHYRYQQHYKNVPVEGGELLIHTVGEQVKLLNGKLLTGLDLAVEPSLTAEQAVNIALQELDAESYLWESVRAEAMLKLCEKDPSATFRPQAKLVVVDPTFLMDASAARLAYTFEVQAQKPLLNELFFVDAVTGEILRQINQMHTTTTPALGQTKYDGEQQIVTDSIAPDTFRLRETTRGGGIFTFDLQTTTNVDFATDYIDADNYWENNDSVDIEAAISAHWGAAQTFDYLLEKHNYIGVDNDSMPLISYVNYGVSVVNAFWNGRWATFGNGDGPRSALTSLDVVGHEFTHGITRSTANLLYYREAGALNESFSDIFGEAVENYSKENGTDWLIGADFHAASGDAFRDMSNPKAEGDPDTYNGQNWVGTATDNFGVHSNSGVQNYWFYLLTEGGTGTNDMEQAYEVNGLGIDVAGDIAFRNLQFYLVRLSQYRDARLGSLAAAEDIFGLCSPEVEETARAWHAVGVGMPIRDFDIQPIDMSGLSAFECGIADTTYLDVTLRYNGCAVDIEAGTALPIAYRINGAILVEDTLILDEPLTSGATLDLTLGPITAFAAEQEHRILMWTALEGDAETNNDTIRMDILNIGPEAEDVRLSSVENPASACLMGADSVRLNVQFTGCDSLPVNSMIELGFKMDNGLTVTDSFTTEEVLYYGESVSYTFDNLLLDFSDKGQYAFDAWARYASDIESANDTLYQFMVTHAQPITVQEAITFDYGPAGLDTFWMGANRLAAARIAEGEGDDETSAMQMTGSNFIDNAAYETWPYEREDRIAERFQEYGSRVCFCADLTNLSVGVLRFDLKQTLSPYHKEVEGVGINTFSIARLTINGEPEGPVYNPSGNPNPNFSTKTVILGNYLGSTAEICIESINALAPEFDPYGVGDNTFVDNIFLTGIVTNTNELEAYDGQVAVYPNPNTGDFQVEIDAPEAGQGSLQLFNTVGQQVWAQNYALGAGTQQLNVRAAHLPKGVYNLQLIVNNQRYTQKIVIN